MYQSKILAIDFSTSNTGYAFHHPETGEYIVGSISGGSKSWTDRVDKIIAEMKKVIEEYEIQDYFIAIEEPIKGRGKGAITLIRANGYFLGAMKLLFNMGFVDVPNATWASYNFIKGKREERKEQSMDILRASGLFDESEIDDDKADAYCILLYMDSLNKGE